MDDLSQYELIETVFENDSIEVYQARDVAAQNKVIIKSAKSLRPSMQLLASFGHEFQINHSLNLKGLIHCQKLINQHDAHQLIYDYVPGVSLNLFLQDKALELAVFFPIALGIVTVITELHAHHVIHKDIKPANILINPKTLKTKLFDLSLASQLTVEHQEVISVNQLEGSLPYMAPEQTGRVNLSIDYRSDYYALGITFYELLTGVLPFTSTDPLGYVHCHLAVEAASVSSINPAIPKMLSDLVAKMMAKSPDARYQSATGLIADLEYCYTQWQETGSIPEFVLGRYEVQDSLVLSSKIYGREQEISTMLESFERVKQGGVEALLVSGYSGIGKTTVINELQRPITMGRGQYISGKFDLLQRTIPYSAFTTALVKLVRHWLTESEAQLARRKTQLLEALGQNGQVILEFLPELELIIGLQPEVERLPPEQAQIRFIYNFQNFIAAIATIDEPLVMFIDDLQWIDQGSLMLLEQILSAQDLQSLLFLGAYRDNEVDDTHPFVQLLGKLKKSDVVIQEIKLSPLTPNHTQLFIADSIPMKDEGLHALAELVFHKTQGNPFFTREFLKECFNDELLVYSAEDKLWHCDIAHIAAHPGAANVIDLMLSKISKLPVSNQKLLQLGACVGMTFDLDTLAHLTDTTEQDIINGLAPCLQEGLIQKAAEGLGYRFIHDRIQQAAYQMLSEEEKQQIHLKAGRLLLEKRTLNTANTEVFAVLDHFKRCTALISSTEEKKSLAALALVGGKQAQASGANEAAYDCVSSGLVWAEDFNWDDEYQLLWDLNFVLVESLFLLKKYEDTLQKSQFLLHHSKPGIDKAYVYVVILKTYNALGQFKESIALGHKAFAQLNLNIVSNPSPIDLLIEYSKFRWHSGWGNSIVQRFNKIKVTPQVLK